MSDKFGDGRDPYLYPGLNVMRNLLGIHQAQRLEQAAYELTALRAATLELGPLARGLPHLCLIHRHLYQDVFDWAGKFREVDIYEGDTPFCHFEYIEKDGERTDGGAGRAKSICVGSLRMRRLLTGLATITAKSTCCIPSVAAMASPSASFSNSWRCTRVTRWTGAISSLNGGARRTRRGATGDLDPLNAIFAKVVSEARESE